MEQTFSGSSRQDSVKPSVTPPPELNGSGEHHRNGSSGKE